MIDLIGGIRGALAALAGAAVMFVALGAYDRLVDDPAVAREARAGFVALAEKTALEAQIAELKRQADARAAAQADFDRRRLVADALAAARAEKLEQEIADYETQLATANRLCRLSGADIEWLRKP